MKFIIFTTFSVVSFLCGIAGASLPVSVDTAMVNRAPGSWPTKFTGHGPVLIPHTTHPSLHHIVSFTTGHGPVVTPGETRHTSLDPDLFPTFNDVWQRAEPSIVEDSFTQVNSKPLHPHTTDTIFNHVPFSIPTSDPHFSGALPPGFVGPKREAEPIAGKTPTLPLPACSQHCRYGLDVRRNGLLTVDLLLQAYNLMIS